MCLTTVEDAMPDGTLKEKKSLTVAQVRLFGGKNCVC